MHTATLIPVILAGGSGERLWPLSKIDYPKQFVTFDESGHSLFQQTMLRVADRSRFGAPVIVCNHLHRFIVSEQLRALAVTDATLIVEPVMRNTAPALALAALHVEEHSLHATLLVLPADHQITQPEAFYRAVTQGMAAAAHGHLVTFAMTPDAAETGYGYLRIGAPLAEIAGAYRLDRFIEKPDRATAESYLASGDYGWNSGMFMGDNGQLLQELARHAPHILGPCRTAYGLHMMDGDFLRPDRYVMESCPADSIDYALMEHTTRGAVIPAAMGWCDLGSWNALHAISPKDVNGNSSHGHVISEDTADCHIRAEDGMLVATIGLRDLVIVAADNALLVGAKERMQDIKRLLARMREQYIPDLNLRAFAHRPWGSFAHIDSGAQYQVKKLHVKPGGKISLQAHAHRSEHWVVVAGRATVTNGNRSITLEANQSTYIPAGTVHRLENRDATDLIVIEVQTGDYLGEDDIERFEDAYNRTGIDA